MNHPSTIEVKPGYGFDVMVTKDRVFSGAYKGLRRKEVVSYGLTELSANRVGKTDHGNVEIEARGEPSRLRRALSAAEQEAVKQRGGERWKRRGGEAREEASVVQQDKGNVVPHDTPRLFLNRLRPFSHHARTIPAYHIVWSVPHRMVRADFARPRGSQAW
jgi:hypothetical protein